MSNTAFGKDEDAYVLNDQQEEEFQKYMKLYEKNYKMILHFIDLYRHAENKSSFKRFEQAIRLLFENDKVEIEKMDRTGKIWFGNYKRDKYCFYYWLEAEDDRCYNRRIFAGVNYVTTTQLTEEEKAARLAEARKKEEAAHKRHWENRCKRFVGYDVQIKDWGKKFVDVDGAILTPYDIRNTKDKPICMIDDRGSICSMGAAYYKRMKQNDRQVKRDKRKEITDGSA